jgi:hypothetical protein
MQVLLFGNRIIRSRFQNEESGIMASDVSDEEKKAAVDADGTR